MTKQPEALRLADALTTPYAEVNREAALAQPEQDVDYWIKQHTEARQAELELRRELEALKAERNWVGLTRDEVDTYHVGGMFNSEWEIYKRVEAKLKVYCTRVELTPVKAPASRT